jgi:hypothetical protein
MDGRGAYGIPSHGASGRTASRAIQPYRPSMLSYMNSMYPATGSSGLVVFVHFDPLLFEYGVVALILEGNG